MTKIQKIGFDNKTVTFDKGFPQLVVDEYNKTVTYFDNKTVT